MHHRRSTDRAEALEAGLVNYIVPDAELDSKLAWLLHRIIDRSPTGIRLGKISFHAMHDMTIRAAGNTRS